MQLVSIDGSSSVKAAGFDAGVLRVLFHGGRYADYPDRTEADFAELLAAPSKGRYVNERLAGRVAAAERAKPLDTFEHDDCCSARLSRAIAGGRLAGVNTWECPACSVEWTAESVPGLGRHWKPRVWFTRF